MQFAHVFVVLGVAGLALSGCSKQERAPIVTPTEIVNPTLAAAEAQIAPLQNTDVEGVVYFFETDKGVRVYGELRGLEPHSMHGLHVHERGDCSAQDGHSAGEHFAPHGGVHGAVYSDASHLGDLGNVVASESGVATVDVIKEGATLDDSETSLIMRGLVLHEEADDLKSQPAGGSGERIACGVILAAK